MVTDLRNRKLDRAFGHMDLDADGTVGREDLLGLGARILVGFGESPTTTTGRKLIDSFDAIWDTLAGDRDGRITAEEFHGRMTAAFIEGDSFEPVFAPAAQAVAELCDTDGDGQIGPAEFRIMLSAFCTAYDDVDAAFDRLDRDVDGRLSVAELVEATRQYYTGDDPHAAGNWLYGPL
ncbi:EF-hand domain-containing protein [Nonomuraea sp. NPDC050556]|uniref:EF-hand domain-containing protein n=1 Tax=Nonomuraea sp. NPDC050556 TaxID=3364369 RepID=UPI0037B86B34